MTIDQAIERSISHNEITRCDATREELDTLLVEADDYCDLTAQYGHWDVWGKRNGSDYRVYVKLNQ